MASYGLSWDGSKEYIFPPISSRLLQGSSTARGRKQLSSRGFTRLNSTDSFNPTNNSTIFPYKWATQKMYHSGPYKPPKTVASKFSKLPKLNFSEIDHMSKQPGQKITSVLLDSTTCKLNDNACADLVINGEGSMSSSMEAIVNFKENVKKSLWHGRPLTKTRETLGDRNITSAAISESEKTAQSLSSLDDEHSVLDADLTRNISIADKKEIIFPIILNHNETTSKLMQQTSLQVEPNASRRVCTRAPLKPIQSRLPPEECKFGVLLNGDIKAQIFPIKLAQRLAENDVVNSPEYTICQKKYPSNLNINLIESQPEDVYSTLSTATHLVDSGDQHRLATTSTPASDLCTANYALHTTASRLSSAPTERDRDTPISLSLSSDNNEKFLSSDWEEIQTKGSEDELQRVHNDGSIHTKDVSAEPSLIVRVINSNENKPIHLGHSNEHLYRKQTAGESKEINRQVGTDHEVITTNITLEPNITNFNKFDDSYSINRDNIRQIIESEKDDLESFLRKQEKQIKLNKGDQSLTFLPKAVKSAKRIKGLGNLVGIKIVDTDQYDLFRNEKIHSRRDTDPEDGSQKISEIVETKETVEIAFPYGEAHANFNFRGKYGPVENAKSYTKIDLMVKTHDQNSEEEHTNSQRPRATSKMKRIKPN